MNSFQFYESLLIKIYEFTVLEEQWHELDFLENYAKIFQVLVKYQSKLYQTLENFFHFLQQLEPS